MDQEEVLGGIKVLQEALQHGSTVMVILEEVGIQTMGWRIGIIMAQEGIPVGILKEQVAFPAGT